ncbi:MAG: hypothetical protein GTN78_22545 [Gemmatimonadales bacterium]|nr:hypothetical protein [Gemmatimonadales bacterium]NIR02946.1 hypothetical protein [Gemmatimonadales bacterium]
MWAQYEVWNALREAEDKLHSLGGKAPSSRHLWEKFSALHRRLHHDPPAGKSETMERLRAMRDECWAELAQFRTAVEEALTIAERRDASWW